MTLRQCKGFAKRVSPVCLHNFKPEADIMAGVLGTATIRELDTDLSGSVVGPEDPDYETARRIWNAAIDKRPALIVRATSTEDVARAVAFARSEGRSIAVRGGAHSVAGFSTCDDGIVMRSSTRFRSMLRQGGRLQRAEPDGRTSIPPRSSMD
jgi:hypothetical protein